MIGDIKVKCKKCGRTASAAEFVLDPIYGMMVCQGCVKDRRSGQIASQIKEQKPEEPKKPAGWDREDEYLEKAYRQKMKSMTKVQQVDDERVMYECPNCKYTFKYNFVKKTPARCPYCSNDIYKIRF
jgi:rubrerythrin